MAAIEADTLPVQNIFFQPCASALFPREYFRFDEETIQKLLEKEWWNGSEEDLKTVEELEFRVNDYLN